MKRLSLPYQLMLLAVVVLAAFYPTQFAEISLIDDLDVIGTLLGKEDFSLREIFIPRRADGGYYRPFIGLSYWLDTRLWFLDERILHFEGVLAHLLNGLLLFFVCREALRHLPKKEDSLIPLAAGLLFSLHPIVTESVNWISGRTDIMMGNFVLLSVFLLLRGRRLSSTPLLVLAAVPALLALLAKEAAFAWLPGFTMFILYRPVDPEVAHASRGGEPRAEWRLFAAYYLCASLAAVSIRSFWLVLFIALAYFVHCLIRLDIISGSDEGKKEVRRRLIFLGVAFLAAATLFFTLRRIAFSSDTGKIGQTITLIGEDTNHAISMFLGAVGFYLKKFFIPIPLNFFIREIDPLYDFLGIAVLMATLRIMLSIGLPALFFLAGIFFMVPALPFAFGTIAWTAYAERYIYLSSAFWILAISIGSAEWSSLYPAKKNLLTAVVVALCLTSASVTFARNRTWLTNVGIMADTVEKSPHQRKLRDIYMYALLQAGNIEEAKRQYGISRKIRDTFYDDRADIIMGNELRREGRDWEALQLYRDALKRCGYGSEALLAASIEHLRHMKARVAATPEERFSFASLEREYEARLLRITRSPGRLVEAGRRALERGETVQASSLLDEALGKMKRTDRLYPAALRLKNEAGAGISK
jgi:hypothetical protein